MYFKHHLMVLCKYGTNQSTSNALFIRFVGIQKHLVTTLEYLSVKSNINTRTSLALSQAQEGSSQKSGSIPMH